MKVITRKIKPKRVAYLRHVGPYEDTKPTWFDLLARLSADKQIRKRSMFIGIGHDNPSVTPAAELRYDACITVAEDYAPKPPVAVQIIAGGDCAIVENCPVGEIKDAFQHLYGKWLVRSSRELRPEPGFVVLRRPRGEVKVSSKKQRVDIYMPLQPKRPLRLAEPLTIEVTTLKPQRVAYLRQVGPYDCAYRVWTDFKARLKPDGLPRKDSWLIGVPLDNPKLTPPEKLRYDACATVDETYVPTRPVRVRTLAGGDYVVARNCPIRALAKGYEKLYRSWLPQSGRTARKAPSLLVTVNGHEGTVFGFRDIYVPLEATK